ncbi:hypothetical protein BURPS406E_R0333 [Burkholderia pseudomallei 406e]|nr:hypothetical protein BPC006_I1276 [Burkholderia pseudomallei BPC006]EDO85557.1 hypothetical protein BURPS406E_R0333 [Burkholderia pseudomallei 406e]EDS84657.1 hypothetical protein BURPSS13_H0135 [Burkholderia pseudomallei S13]EDU08830.1 hypothetical protein BURPS1655_K0107 [Burkholderia pseudomallei 1655]
MRPTAARKRMRRTFVVQTMGVYARAAHGDREARIH